MIQLHNPTVMQAAVWSATELETKITSLNWAVKTKSDQSKYGKLELVAGSGFLITIFFVCSHLPPNQGGKYTGFGNPAFESQGNNNRNGGDMNDMMNDPMQALTKGWSLLSVGVGEIGKVAGQIGKYANENYVRPAQEQWNDPNFRNNVNGYTQSLYTNLDNNMRSNSSSIRSSAMSSSSHTSSNDDGDFFNNTISNLKQQQQSPVGSRSSSPVPAKNGYGSMPSTVSSRSRTPLRESAKKPAAKDNSDDEWEGW
ncbi:hypothetical protein BCR42DRAFT_36047 [Absidia repens]|uniref:Uncharacterized protein n=1 Tax=Absidia repens TaxID=90262 RepID=A0A1X2IH08_9FUNG|nr:hypothetical protein BCR42DRAFT_36047 [Absidia repens]